ncbi:hypothetical protein D9M71_718230 [compost metagenome]
MNMTRKPREQRSASYLSVGAIGDGRDFAVTVGAPSRASPLPQVFWLFTNVVFHPVHCGSGLAREEASRGTTKNQYKKSPRTTRCG